MHGEQESLRAAGRPLTAEALGAHALAAGWSPEALPWDDDRGFDELSFPDAASLLASTALLTGMSPSQRERAKRLELSSHLSALAYGEMRATTLAAETVLLFPEEASVERFFVGTLLADEAKHHRVLERYLTERLAGRVRPHPALEEVFAALSGERDLVLNLLVGQVVLEGAAASLLNALLLGAPQGLLREMLRHIGRDEARHMKFAHLMHAAGEGFSAARQRRSEELLFEAAFAACASLVASGAWPELGLDPRRARNETVDRLAARGAITYFTRVVARQLGHRGFQADRLEKRLSRQLEQRLREVT